MTYKCKQDLKFTPILFMALLTAFAACLSFGANSEGTVMWLLLGLSAIFASISLKLAARYLIYQYVYVLTDDFVKIYRISGKNSTLLANVPYYDCTALLKDEESIDFSKSLNQKLQSFDYTQNLFPQNTRYLYFESASGRGEMRLEASDEFYGMLLHRMPSKQV